MVLISSKTSKMIPRANQIGFDVTNIEVPLQASFQLFWVCCLGIWNIKAAIANLSSRTNLRFEILCQGFNWNSIQMENGAWSSMKKLWNYLLLVPL